MAVQWGSLKHDLTCLLVLLLATTVSVASSGEASESWRTYVESIRSEPVDGLDLFDTATAAWEQWIASVNNQINATAAAVAEFAAFGNTVMAQRFTARKSALLQRLDAVLRVRDAHMKPLTRAFGGTTVDDGDDEHHWPLRSRALPPCRRPTTRGVGYDTVIELLGHLRRDYHAAAADDSHWAAHRQQIVQLVAAEIEAQTPLPREFVILIPGTGLGGLQNMIADTVSASPVATTTFRIVGTDCSRLFLSTWPWLTGTNPNTAGIPLFDARLGHDTTLFDEDVRSFTRLYEPLAPTTRRAIAEGVLENHVFYNDLFASTELFDSVAMPCADVLLTSYVIDAVTRFGDRGGGVRHVLDRLWNLTCAGGIWINYGPLAYHDPAPTMPQSDGSTAVLWTVEDIMTYTVAGRAASTTSCTHAAWMPVSGPVLLEAVGYTAPLQSNHSTLVHGHRPLFWALRRCSG